MSRYLAIACTSVQFFVRFLEAAVRDPRIHRVPKNARRACVRRRLSHLAAILTMADTVKALLAFKDEGNGHYKEKEFAAAIAAYSKGVKLLPYPEDSEDEAPMDGMDADLLKQGAIVLCNRAAAYMGDNKPIPALADAQRAADCDPSNWKAHWRQGLALMMMKPRLERSEQASPTGRAFAPRSLQHADARSQPVAARRSLARAPAAAS